MSDESDPDLVQFRTECGLYIDDPWERVKFIFQKNPHGEHHPDLMEVYRTAELGLLTGVVFGGHAHQKKLLLEIKERSDAKLFSNKTEAYRQMSRESLRGFVDGAFKWGPRVAIFTGGFKLFASCVEAYRNKTGIIEHSIGGAAIGCILKWNFGIRGMFVGSLVGMVLGSVYGVTYFGICKLIKKDAIEVKYGQYALSKYLNQREAEDRLKKDEQELGRISQPEAGFPNLNPLNALEDDEKD